MLPNDATLADLWASGVLGADPGNCVLALDFDQTLTQVDKSAPAGQQLKMRGGEASRRALQQMHAAGVTLLIITAQSPSVQTIVNLAGEVRHLGLQSLFGLTADGGPAADEPPSPPKLLSGSSSMSVAHTIASAAAPDVPVVVTLDGGVKIARMANLLAARYNKPEAFEYWLRNCAPSGKPSPTRLAFVDDNSDNAVSMFMHFAASEMRRNDGEAAARPTAPDAGAPCIPICAVWYPPPAGLKGETFDEDTRALLMAVSKGEIAAGGALASGVHVS